MAVETTAARRGSGVSTEFRYYYSPGLDRSLSHGCSQHMQGEPESIHAYILCICVNTYAYISSIYMHFLILSMHAISLSVDIHIILCLHPLTVSLYTLASLHTPLYLTQHMYIMYIHVYALFIYIYYFSFIISALYMHIIIYT